MQNTLGRFGRGARHLGLAALCAFSQSALAAPEVQVIHDWGQVEEVHQLGRFFVAPALDQAALAKFKEQSGAVVVDLRTPKEMDCGVRAAGVQMGLKYHLQPLETTAELKPETVAKLAEAVREAGEAPVLVSCQTGNRAAALLTAYLVSSGALERKDAPAVAKTLGLRAKGMQERLARYLSIEPGK